MKLIEQIDARLALMAHAQEKLPVRLGYKIMKMLKASDDDFEFYQKEINNIINDCAEKDPNGEILRSSNGNPIIQNGKIEECNKRIKELEEAAVNGCEMNFILEELSPIQFSVDELSALDVYIKQD